MKPSQSWICTDIWRSAEFQDYINTKERGKYGPFAELAWDPVPKDLLDDNVLKASFASVLTTNISFQKSQIPEISLQQ